MLSRVFRQWIEARLKKRDYLLKDRFAPMRGYEDFLDLAKLNGFSPGTVIDVGVAEGTPWLHNAFPHAHLVLIEPQKSYANEITAMLAGRSGEWHAIGVGEKKGTVQLNILNAIGSSASIKSLGDAQKASFGARDIDYGTRVETIPVERLDSLDTANWPKPWLLKIDVEGFETEVMRGASGLLPDVRMVIAEIALGKVYEDTDFIDTLVSFRQLGFELYDIINMMARGRHGRVTMIDGVFLRPEDDMLN